MSSILDINSGSSDSEDDQDYVPPKAPASDESDDEISEEEEISGEPTSKKIKIDEKEITIDKEAANSIWQDFLKGVDASSRNGSQKKAIASSSNLLPRCETSSNAENNSLSNAKEKTSDLEKSASDALNSEKEIISEKTKKGDIFSDLSTEKNEIPSEKMVLTDTADKTESKKVKAASADVEIKTAKSGLSSILGAIGNKGKKMTVLEKSMLDWRNYKKEEGIEKDLETFNKGRQGFIERQRFLERSDLRLFETEKTARLGGRKK